MGHSYGAFMTANLLAHSDLFRAGIARSGAYNRTLTPFGFQNEERTYWQAPEVYLQDEPVLLRRQDQDAPSCSSTAKPTTIPAPSPSRARALLRGALKGEGATVRFVSATATRGARLPRVPRKRFCTCCGRWKTGSTNTSSPTPSTTPLRSLRSSCREPLSKGSALIEVPTWQLTLYQMVRTLTFPSGVLVKACTVRPSPSRCRSVSSFPLTERWLNP
jgi:hypothetical protein